MDQLPDNLFVEFWSVVKRHPGPKDKDNGAYLVRLNRREEWSCTCPHWEIRCKAARVNCKHIDDYVLPIRQLAQAALESPASSPPTPSLVSPESW